jgi:hypothetical protein
MFFDIRHFLINHTDYRDMIRVVAIALVAMATFDMAFLGGQHVYAVETIMLDLLHQFLS